MTELKVPEIGESITEVTLSEWKVAEGDYVKRDQIICEFESEKATLDFPSDVAGTITFVASEDEDLEIGAVVCKIDETAEAPKEEKTPKASPELFEENKDTKDDSNTLEKAKKEIETNTVENKPAGPPKFVELVVPVIGESISEVTLSQWKVSEGEYIKRDQIICEFESEKATLDFPAEKAGAIQFVAAEGDDLEIGAVVAKINVNAAAPAEEIVQVKSTPVEKEPATPEGEVKATPVAEAMIADKKIDATKVSGSGSDGRITKSDVLEFMAGPIDAGKAPFTRDESRKKMSKLRRTISRRLVEAKNTTAMLTTFNEVDMGPIKDLRTKYKEEFKEKHGIGLGFMSFFTRAVAIALQEWPSVNAYIDGNEIIYHDYVDISIAVSAPKGLVVPVIRNAESLTMDGIEKEVKRLALRARENKLDLAEMQGGTFTLTNGGVFGSLLSTPIINMPQSAILGMHKIEDRPMAVNGEVVIRPMMYLALSYDHRIIDGRESVGFLVRVKELLEDPTKMITAKPVNQVLLDL
jgi:2-oxoglutarate dehydrogenase E2 component (dihydrolipoamide succinyltransferase)